jgi:hypothetical protein
LDFYSTISLKQQWWLSPGTPASSTTKTVRHDIAEILFKVALKHQKSNQIYQLVPRLSAVMNVRNVISPSQGIKIDGEKPDFCYPIKFVLPLFNNQ